MAWSSWKHNLPLNPVITVLRESALSRRGVSGSSPSPSACIFCSSPQHQSWVSLMYYLIYSDLCIRLCSYILDIFINKIWFSNKIQNDELQTFCPLHEYMLQSSLNARLENICSRNPWLEYITAPLFILLCFVLVNVSHEWHDILN